ncbi:TonB-dependent receptor [Pseudoduganella sp. FT93W]|uniref:TonB-dependent receptor n=1 Tax=Duganella fentianensis TaxID=2692177 RepID=A0A845HXT2_9BURK|nr:outer membrane beta-barrel family protein [Duganella fentianensis]MYN45672.1 TonB-dependent receptor [Duganella fentianensis]
MRKILLSACLASPLAALAQTSPAAASNSSPSANNPATTKASPARPAEVASVIPSVNVAGERPTNRIDRQVYDVKSDISTSNSTAADALNNVPSVAVDPDGTVTLRGSSNVQILVDGKPSAMLQGENRGATLNAMQADDIESVEVINNPGAQFGNEAGGGPILNLVMRRNRKAGGFANLNANAGVEGRYNSAFSGSYNEGAWGIQGGAHIRHDGRNSTADVSRDRLDSNGNWVHSSQQSSGMGLNDMSGVNSTVNYNLNATDTLAASANYNARTNDQHGVDHYINGATALQPLTDYVRTTQRSGDARNFGWGTRYDHKGELPNEVLKIDLRVSASENESDNLYANSYASGNLPNTRAAQHNNSSIRIVDFTGDYERPLWGGSAKAGYKIATNTSDAETAYTDINPYTSAVTLNPARSNHYQLEETVVALYGSYQLRLNDDWGLLAGLRSEHTALDIHQYTSNVEASNNYLNFMPSLFATYKLSEASTLRFAYARRIRRPNANDLNPYVVYRDEFNVSSGNPMLKPTKTDSFEVGYETKLFGLETNLRSYYRRDTDAIVDYRTLLANNVLLTTRRNGEGSHSSGLEFTMSGKLTPELTLNTSGNLMRMQQTTLDDQGLLSTRTANSLSGRVRLNYAYSAATQVQMALQMQGKMLSGQGYRSPNSTFNLSLRQALTPRLSMLATVTDLFNTNKMETVVDSATLRETSTRRFDGRVFYLGLSYRFGGPNKESEQHEPRMGPPPGGPGGGPGFGAPPPQG